MKDWNRKNGLLVVTCIAALLGVAGCSSPESPLTTTAYYTSVESPVTPEQLPASSTSPTSSTVNPLNEPLVLTISLPGIREEFPTNSRGELTTEVKMESADGALSLLIENGTSFHDKDGEPVYAVDIKASSVPLPEIENTFIIGTAYEFTPDGITSSHPLRITLKYNSDNLSQGVSEKDIYVACYSEGEWKNIDNKIINTEGRFVEAQIDHFCWYAALVPLPSNLAPVLDNLANQTAYQGKLLEFSVHASDPENDNLTYRASNLPPGATFNRATQVFSFVPESIGNYDNVSFSVSDGQWSDSQTIVISALPVIPELLQGAPDNDLPLVVIYYGTHTPAIDARIMKVKPQYVIINSPNGLWGHTKQAVLKDIAGYQAAGIKVIGYVTSGYEGTGSAGNIEPKWYTLEMNRKLIRDMANIDHVDGVFIDECSNFPDADGKTYLKELTALAHSLGLITWGNVGMDNFDPWYFTEGGFDLMHSSENWRGQSLSKAQLDWGYRISVTGFSPEYTAQDAFNLTVKAWRKGLAYCYVTSDSLGYNKLPDWLGEYADMLRQYQLHPEQYQPPPEKGNTTGMITGTPVWSGASNEYNFNFKIISTTVDELKSGQQLWCAAKIADFPDMFTAGVTLTGDLDHSSGWWVLHNADDALTK